MGKNNKIDYTELYGLPEGSRVLRLTLEKKAWDITGTIHKPFELRSKSEWIESRILKPNGEFKEFDYVLLINGYSPKSPLKIFEFRGIEVLILDNRIWYFNNGLHFITKTGDYKINLGKKWEQIL